MKKIIVSIFLGIIGLCLLFGADETMSVLENYPLPAKGRMKVTTNPDFGKIPLYFIPNQGQVDKKVQYYAKASRYTIWLTKEGLVFDSFRQVKTAHPAPAGHPSQEGNNRGAPHSPKLERDVSRLVFLNAKKNLEMVPAGESDHKVNYFIGRDRSKWHSNIPTSGSVLYKRIYPGVDLKIYGIEEQIEYDWIVKPGGNPGEIRFQYQNVKSTRLDEAGNLLIETNFGELVHKRPVSYQYIDGKRAAVASAFERTGIDTFGFKLGEYNKNVELVIDPVVMAYSTYLGGWKEDQVKDIAVDGSGHVYVTGHTKSNDFPLLNQYQDLPTAGFDYDVFVARLDPGQSGTASLLYSTYLGSDDNEGGQGIAVDSSGYIYVVGTTRSDDFPVVNAYVGTKGYGNTLFAAKLDPTLGSSGLLYSTFLLGGDTNTNGVAIAADNSGKAYVLGSTQDAGFPTVNAYKTVVGGSDMTISIIDTTLAGTASLLYSTYFGGGGDEVAIDIAVDSQGYVYVGGHIGSTGFPLVNQYQSAAGLSDVVVAKLDTTLGSSGLLYSTYLGGTDYDRCTGIDIDGSGNVYLTGTTNSSNFPTRNPYQSTNTYYDAFIAKLDTTESGNDSLVYSTYFGGQAEDEAADIAVDGSGNLVVAGKTYSNDLTQIDPYQAYQASYDTFVLKMDLQVDGTYTPIFSSYLGGDNWDIPFGVAIDNDNHFYVAGFTVSTDFPILNEYHGDKDTGYDGFITKFTIQSPPGVTTADVTDTTYTSASAGGEVTSDGNADVTARGVCWGTSSNPTTSDDHTTDGSGTGSFTSSITGLNTGTTYYVRAYATNSVDTAYGDEKILITLTPSITLTSPNGAESWQVGSSQTITWTGSGLTGNIKIEYSTNNGGQWTEIAASTEDDGTHPWTVPDAVSSQCLVRVGETGGSPSDTSDAVFSIVPVPAVTVTSPNGAESWQVGSSQTITWTSVGAVGDVKIEYSTNNGSDWVNIIASTENDGTHPWTVPDAVSSQCLVRVGETGGSPSDTSDAVFSIDPVPAVTVTSPNGAESWQVASSQTITWTSVGAVGNVKIEYSTNNGSDWVNIIASTENDGTHPWTVPDAVSSQCLVRVGETGGSPSDTGDAVFSIVPVPAVTVTSPNGGEEWQPGTIYDITWNYTGLNGDITIDLYKGGVFDSNIDITTVNPGSYSWDIPFDFAAGIDYKVRIYQGDVEDYSDNDFSIVARSPFRAVPDFNRDGRGDLIWRYDAPEGYNALWLLGTGGGAGAAAEASPFKNSPADLLVNMNLDAGEGLSQENVWESAENLWRGPMKDGFAGETVWHNNTGFAAKSFAIDNNTRQNISSVMASPVSDPRNDPQAVELTEVADQNWKIAGYGDFNDDGKVDIVWSNAYNAHNCVWYMDGISFAGYGRLPDGSTTDWVLGGVGDFDLDGHPDMIWNNVVDGRNGIWYLDGLQIKGIEIMTTGANVVWKLCGTGDFNSDGKVDVVWRHTGDGRNAVWYMDGTQMTSVGWLDPVADQDWKLRGTGDFNGDGKTDLVWTNIADGQNCTWYLDGVTITAVEFLTTVTDTDWKIEN